MRRRRPPRTSGARTFFATYTHGLRAEDLHRLFTRDTREAYHFFARGIDHRGLAALPRRKRWLAYLRLAFLAFTLKLSPARRALYGFAIVSALLGLMQLFRGIGVMEIPAIPFVLTIGLPAPVWTDGTLWLLTGFLLVNLLVLLEVADRLSLKNDLEIAREIQQAMLPTGPFEASGLQAFGHSRPANTVGGDFYDILPLADGRVAVALGDVAGKGSPAALLMALLLAMLRTLVDEGLEPAPLLERLNTQVARHAPASRFITLFFAVYEPMTGGLTYANAGHPPPVVCRSDGSIERLTDGGVALGMFEGSTYRTSTSWIEPGDLVAIYSDGVTEAESQGGQPFDEEGLIDAVRAARGRDARSIGEAVVDAVGRHSESDRYADDLTVLMLKRVGPVASLVPAQVSRSGV